MVLRGLFSKEVLHPIYNNNYMAMGISCHRVIGYNFLNDVFILCLFFEMKNFLLLIPHCLKC